LSSSAAGRWDRIVLAFGGVYFGTEDKPKGRYTEELGRRGNWTVSAVDEKKRVRQAINKASTRELLKVAV